jgi:PAS domain S-box-containing protein
MNYIRCQANDTHCNIISVSATEVFVILLFVLILFICNSIYQVCIYEWNPFSPDILKKTSSSNTLLTVITRTMTVIVFGLFEYNREYFVQILLCIELLLHHGFMTMRHWYELQYYSHAVNEFIVATSAVNAWASLCALLCVLINNTKDTGTAWMFYFGFFPVVAAGIHFVRQRYDSIEDSTIYALRNPTEVCIRVQLAQRGIMNTWDKGRDHTTVEGGFLGANFREIDNMFILASKRYQDSPRLYFCWSIHAFVYKQNRFLAMSKLKSIVQDAPSPHQTYPAVVQLRYVAEVSSLGSRELDIGMQVEQQKIETECREEMTTCLMAQLRLWSALNMDTVPMHVIQEVSDDIYHSLKRADIQLKRLLRVNPNSPYYRRLYANFLLYVANDAQAAGIHLQKAVDLAAGTKNSLSDETDDVNNAIIIISGEKDRMGEILQLNIPAAQLFGYGQEELIGKKVNQLMSKPYGEVHNGHVAHYVNTKESTFVNTKRTLMMKHAQGYIFMADIRVREYAMASEEPSVGFLGIIHPHSRQPNVMIVEIEEFTIVDVSSGIMAILPATSSALKSGELSLDDWIPNLENLVGDIVNELDENPKCEVVIDPKDHIGFEKVPYKFSFQFLPLHAGGDHFLVNVELLEGLVPISTEKDADSLGSSEFSGESNASINISPSTPGPPMPVPIFSRRDEDDSIQQSIDTFNSGSTAMVPQSNLKFIETQGQQPTSANIIAGRRNAQILKLLLESKETSTNMYIQRLLSVIGLALVVLSILAIASHALWLTFTLNRFKASINIIYDEGTLRTSTAACTYSTYLYKYKDLANLTVEDMAIGMKEVKDMVNGVDELRTRLRECQTDPSVEVLGKLQYVPINIQMFDFSVKTLSAVEILHLYALMANKLVGDSTSSTSAFPDSRDLLFYDMNQDSQLLHVLNASVFEVQKAQMEYNITTLHFSLGFTLGSLGLIVLLMILAALPTISKIESQRYLVFQVFQSFSTVLLRDLLTATTEKLGTLIGYEEAMNRAAVFEFTGNLSLQAVQAKEKLQKSQNSKSKHSLMTHRSFAISSGKMLISLTIVVVYFLGLQLWWEGNRTTIYDEINARINYAQYRHMLVKSMNTQILGIDDTGAPQVNLTALEAYEVELWNVEHAIIYGRDDIHLHHSLDFLPKSDAYMFSNLCITIRDVSKDECASFLKGVMTRGLHEALMHYITLSQRVRQAYGLFREESSDGPMKDQLLERISTMRKMGDKFLSGPLLLSAETLKKEIETLLEDVSQTRYMLTVLFVLINGLLFFGVYRPMMNQMNSELLKSQNMLRVIPIELLEYSANIKSLVQAVITSMSSS